MKGQSLFSGENKKTIINLSSVELAQKFVKINIQQGLQASYSVFECVGV